MDVSALDWSVLPGVVLGGIIAVGAGLVQSRQARKASREQFDREQAARRDDEVRARADVKADEILTNLYALERLVSRRLNPRGFLMPSEPTDREEIIGFVRAVEVASAYLQQPLRRNVEVLGLLPELDEMYGRGFMTDTPRTAGLNLIRFARKAAARYLRGERQLDLSDSIEEYRRQNDDLRAFIEADIERRIAESEAADSDEAHEAEQQEEGGDQAPRGS